MFLTKLKDILHLFYPPYCIGCSDHLSYHHDVLCVHCMHKLPYTYYSNQKNNSLEQLFFGKIPLETATSLLSFQPLSIVQNLIHELKYKNNQHIGEFLGELLADEISESLYFKNIDCIIPVPLHPDKLKQRGYNQLSSIGNRLSKKLHIPYIEGTLTKTTSSATQTKKDKFDRWKNAQHTFLINDKSFLENKHILLIDDVITTGATLEACSKELLRTNNVRISIATIAHTINF